MQEIMTLVMMSLWNAPNRRLTMSHLANHSNVAHINPVQLVLAIHNLEESGEIFIEYRTKDRDGNLSEQSWNDLEQFFEDNTGRGIYDMTTIVGATLFNKD